jgi:hypothetical protein
MKRRYQECDPVGKLFRLRWYILYPYYFFKYLHAGRNNANFIATYSVQEKMNLTQTMAEIKRYWVQHDTIDKDTVKVQRDV